MRILSFMSLALLTAVPLLAQEPRTSVAVAPPDVKAPPADAIKSPSGLASKVITPGPGKVHPTAAEELVTMREKAVSYGRAAAE